MFSAVIPVYNHEKYLVSAISSCLSSPLVTEVIVVDDGSSDRSAEILSHFAEAYPNKIRNLTEDPPVNRGAHERINQLICAATNEWVAVLNSDDIFGTGRFEAVARVARSTKADLFFGMLSIIDQSDKRLGARYPLQGLVHPWPCGTSGAKFAEEQDWLPILVNQNIIATTSNMIFKKSLFEEIGGFRDFRYVHDWDFALRAAIIGRVQYLHQMTTYYRIHPQNTIKEDSVATREEVVHLFADIAEDFSDTFARIARQSTARDRAITASLGNNALLQSGDGFLHVVVPPKTPDALRQKLSAEFPLLGFSNSLAAVPATASYVYAPSSPSKILSDNDLRNAILSLCICPYDFVLASKSFQEFPSLGVERKQDNMIVSRSLAAPLLSSAECPPATGRIARLLPADARPSLAEIVLGNTSIAYHDGDISLSGHAGRPSFNPSLYPLLLGAPAKTKPVVFIFPTFIAVGGVERIMIEMMRRLSSYYDFVIVCTERLSSHQGSWHDQALQHAAAIFDLAEILPKAAYPMALRFLRHAYKPDLIWILNGSVWQCDNASTLRSIFRDIPIVDHQVYDSEVGWVTRFDEAALRTSDRFVAINSRISRVFVERYHIPESRIDLIYHPFNSDMFDYTKFDHLDPQEIRASFGIPDGKRVFAFIGRVSAQKRPLDFIRLAERHQRSGDETSFFLMVGDGVLGPECDDLIEASELTNFRRIGFCDDLTRVYKIIDGLIITSEYEGLPVAMLETLAMGVPVLSTDVGDIKLVLEKYGSGAVVDEIGDIDALYAGFVEWAGRLDDYTASARASSGALRSEFSGETVSGHYRDCFERAISQKKAKLAAA